MKKWHFFPFLVLLFAGISFSACEKESDNKEPEIILQDPPKAIISVVRLDVNDVKWPVANCEVWLDIPEGTPEPELIEYATKHKLTDINGQVEYEFTSEGILTVKAQKGEDAESCGVGVLILKMDEVYHEEIHLSACE